MRPVHHATKLSFVHQVPFQCGQEYLRRVAEHDDSQRYGEGPDVYFDLHVRPSPFSDPRQTVDYDDGVY